MTISEWEQANRDSIDQRRAEYERTKNDKPNSYEVEMYKRRQGLIKASLELAKVREAIEDLVGYRYEAKSLIAYMEAADIMLQRGLLTEEVIKILRSLYDTAQIDAKAQLEEANE